MSQPGTKRAERRWQMPDWVVWLIALVGPAVLTAALLGITGTDKRNYVFLYLGLIAAVGIARGLWPALLAAIVSFAFLDYCESSGSCPRRSWPWRCSATCASARWEALRESAFRVIADHADRQLVGFMRESQVEAPWEVRGRIVVCIAAQPNLESRIRRNPRLRRSSGCEVRSGVRQNTSAD
jgi:K+-sensing histidine kinase KdpD